VPKVSNLIFCIDRIFLSKFDMRFLVRLASHVYTFPMHERFLTIQVDLSMLREWYWPNDIKKLEFRDYAIRLHIVLIVCLLYYYDLICIEICLSCLR
jgi:hypothetical protein